MIAGNLAEIRTGYSGTEVQNVVVIINWF